MIRSIVIKIFAKFFLFIGRLLRRPVAGYDLSGIRKILVNKSDRLGDAVVTLPLLLELQKHYDVTVLTSERNDEFLRRFVRTQKWIGEPRPFPEVLAMLWRSLWNWGRKRVCKEPVYDLYLDLNGIKELDLFLRVWSENLCAHYAGFNMGLWNFLLDYSHPDYSVLFSNQHVLDAYRELVKAALGRDIELGDSWDPGDHAVVPAEVPTNDFIIVNVAGYEKFRGPSPVFFARLIEVCAPQVTCFVLDELGQPHASILKEKLRDVPNVYIAERDFSVWELLGLASRARFYIGSDGGMSHLMQGPTNAILFFGDQRAVVWRPYSCAPYERRRGPGGLVIEQRVNARNFLKAILYFPGHCRQCFDLGCASPCCVNNFEKYADMIQREVLKFLDVRVHPASVSVSAKSRTQGAL